MTLEEFKTQILSDTERNNMSQTEVEILFELSNKFFETTFQRFLQNRKNKTLKKN